MGLHIVVVASGIDRYSFVLFFFLSMCKKNRGCCVVDYMLFELKYKVHFEKCRLFMSLVSQTNMLLGIHEKISL